MDARKLALLAAFTTAIIYGVTFTIAKNVMPVFIKPYAFILLRVFGATILFWIAGTFIKKEKIAFNDFSRIFAAAVFGVALNMLVFFKGLSYTTPISAAVIMVITPILVLTFAVIFLGEKLIKRKIIGILIGLVGAVVLILYGHNPVVEGENAIFGDFLVFVNAASYALYLIIVKKLTQKYNPLTFVKWMYFFGFLLVLPFGYSELQEVDWDFMPMDIYLKTGFVVVFTTFVNYLFNLFALTQLKPTTVSIFIYLQPVIATIFALIVKSDSLNSVKVVATLLIFMGVYLVSKPVKEVKRLKV